MPIYLGNTLLSKLNLGGVAVPRAYLGNTLVFSSGPTDPNLSKRVLLCGFDSAFVDESVTNPKTLTVVGNPVISAQGKFGGAAAFDGAGDRITAPDDNDWSFGAGDFTLEGFYMFLTKQTSQAIMGQWENGGLLSMSSWFFYISGGNLKFRGVVGSTTYDLDYAFAPNLGAWYHIAVDRAAGVLRTYVNGAMVAKNAAYGHNFNASAAKFVLGAIGDGNGFPAFDYNGRMDEVRITKGHAEYASDGGFTVPTEPYLRS